MDWNEVKVHTTTSGAELVSDVLMQAGAGGTQVQDRQDVVRSEKKDGMWDMLDEHILESMPEDVVVTAYFEAVRAPGEVRQELTEKMKALAASLPGFDLGSLEVTCGSVSDQDWAENWKKYYKPFRVGRRLVVRPSWEEYAEQPGDLVLTLDPGMAFGTGSHETTSMCMEQLETYITPGCSCIDVGCGSGILALAAARLGAGDVLAIDLDPDAVRVARENTEKNGLAGTVRTVHGDLLEKTEEQADVVVANIIADVICYLCTPARKHIRKNGIFICSGIIREREGDVLAALEQGGYQVERRLEKGEWVCLAARPKA